MLSKKAREVVRYTSRWTVAEVRRGPKSKLRWTKGQRYKVDRWLLQSMLPQSTNQRHGGFGIMAVELQ